MSSTSTNTQTASTDQQRPPAAQIPLSSFALPLFPPEADSLKALTLSCDIPLSEYSTQLSEPHDFNFRLPQTIEALTLELFSFGYPPGFLGGLAASLPNLRALTVYAQLFAGTTPESREDALGFFAARGKGLRELCLIDAFAEKGFWAEVSQKIGEMGLGFLEITYSYRKGEEGLKGVQSEELVGLVGKNTVGCVLALHRSVENEQGSEEESAEEQVGKDVEDGMLPFGDAKVLVQRLTGPEKPKTLAMLDTTLFTLTGQQLKDILKENKGIKVLSVALEVGVEGLKAEDLEECEGLESLEIVVCPVKEMVENSMQGKDVELLEKDVLNLSKRYPQMTSFKTSILRSREFEWRKADDEWKKI